MTTLTSTRPTKCIHHWVVRPPEGATSWANCRKCGRRRRFNNTFEGRDRANNSDIFVENTTTWRPNWRTESIEPRAREAYEASKLAGVSV